MKPFIRYERLSKGTLSVIDGDGSIYKPLHHLIPFVIYCGNCSRVVDGIRYFDFSDETRTSDGGLTITFKEVGKLSLANFLFYMKAKNRNLKAGTG